MELETLIEDLRKEGYSDEKFIRFLRRIAPTFRPLRDILNVDLKEDEKFSDIRQLGVISLDNVYEILVASIRVDGELTARSSRRKQYNLSKRILRMGEYDAGIFAFYDNKGRFRLSLVTVIYHGTKREFSTFRRYTFFVDPGLPNKTFHQQMIKANFSTMDGILETFSLEAVSDEFYEEFESKFKRIAERVQGTDDPNLKKDFALLFVIRTIFLGFVQKKGWLGDNQKFLQSFMNEYQEWKRRNTFIGDRFYREWLEPLFFEALSSPPGRKVSYGHAPFSENTQKVLQMAPYLNGELFRRKRGIDDQGLWIPDDIIKDFFNFLFQYNFTVEENELYDEELELNPEFLGIIFERLTNIEQVTNMEQGAVYTPRVEVDMMCRLSLVKWLERNSDIPREILYRFFFPWSDPREVKLTPEQIRTLIEKLESVTVCDPAAGSGAFEVGMLQILDRALDDLYSRDETPSDLKEKAPTPFERKKAIIARSLYGVEVKRWAVWISHLRLWLTLFVDMPEDYRYSFYPLLPSLTFKVRVGDSLVQRIGNKSFPIHEHANLPKEIKRKITMIKKKKLDFFYNRLRDYKSIEREEISIFREILDYEIALRRKQLEDLGGLTQGFHATTKPSKVEKNKAKQIENLKREIEDLKAQKENLKEEKPFIWSLEFPEIFFERGGFDIVIGNPPYLSSHSKNVNKRLIDPMGKLSSKEYKKALGEMVEIDFPEYFKSRKPSGRSDLYTYFYIRSLRLLNDKGVHVFICSNAWLDVEYGAWLQEFFLRKAPLYMVIDNHARRSFIRADINTVITLAGAPLKNRELPKDHVVRFVAFKKPFEEVINSENFINIENTTKILKTSDFRVFPITVKELIEEGSEITSMGVGKYIGDKWGGKYLRAPDIFLKIISRKDNKLKLIKIEQISEIMGYVHDNDIGSQYPKVPFIKSIKDTRKIRITDEVITLYGINPKGNNLIKADLLFPRTFGDVHLVLWNDERKVIGKEFYRIVLNNYDPFLAALMMNSTFSILQREIWGIRNLGGGAIKFSMYCLGFFLILRDISIPYHLKQLLNSFVNREIKSTFKEIGIYPESDIPISEQEPNPLPDRKALDDIVFDALGLTEEERKEVYRAVAQLVWERISKAKSVKKNRK